MNKGVKVGLIGGAVLLVLFIASKAKAGIDVAQNLSFRITDFGIPKIQSGVITVPLMARITNPTQNSITVDSVAITGSYRQGTNWQKSATAVFKNVTINPGENDKQFLANVDFRALTKNIFDTLDTVVSSGALDVKFDVVVTIGGIALPVQSFTKSIKIA